MLLSLLQVQKSLGFEPRVLYLKDQNTLYDRIDKLGVEQDTLGIKKFVPAFSDLHEVPRKLRQWQPDVIQAWMYHSDIASLYLKYIARVQAPLVWSIHHSIHAIEQEKLNTRLVIQLLKKLDWIPYKTVFVSQTSANQHRRIGYNSKKIVVIPNGFDTNRFKPNQEYKQKIRQSIGLNEKSRVIGFFGRFDALKDIPNLLSAVEKVLKKQHTSDVKVLMVGREQTEENRQLVSLMKKHRLDDVVYLMGHRDDVEQLYASVDIVVNSSCSEAFPMSVGEAMSSGTPCVVTDVGDSAWIVSNTGEVVPSRDSGALSDAILRLLEISADSRAALGIRARERIISEFSLESVAEQYHSLYRSAIERRVA